MTTAPKKATPPTTKNATPAAAVAAAAAPATSTKSSSAQEMATKIKSLLKSSPMEDRLDAARLDELRRLLATLVQQGDLKFTTAATPTLKESTAAREKWNVWLQKQHKVVVQQLTEGIRQGGRRTSVRTLWGLLAASPQTTVHGHLHLRTDLLLAWLSSLVAMPRGMDVSNDKSLRHLVEAEFEQRDVQYYALRVMTTWADSIYAKINQKTNKSKRKDKDDDDDNVTTLQEQSDRMMYLLLMIPFAMSQETLDSPNSKYLFAAPPKTTNTNKDEYPDKDNDSSDDDDDDNDNSSDDDDDSSSSDDGEDSPSKKQKLLQNNDTNNNNKMKKHKRRNKQKQQYTFAFQDVRCHLKALTKAWMALLRLPLSTTCLKKALPYLSTHVLPHIPNPLRFADLYMQAYSDSGNNNSVIPLLALDGLFYLMTQHRLEYPLFYTQLYALVTTKLLYVKARTRFFALLEKCLLRNEMLPAHLVAAFLKRLLRCALQAPPPSALFVLALSSNLLRQHEECAALIHRVAKDNNDDGELEDVYNAETNDPVQSKALQSSLWELNALEHHYHPAVATLAKSIGREDPKSPMLQLEEMARHTYASLLEQERKRKAPLPKNHNNNKRNKFDNNNKPKAVTPVTFVAPTGLFTKDDVFAGVFKGAATTSASW